MGKYSCVLLFIVAGLQSLSAQNLVINPDFEDNRVCPYRLDSIEFARNWSKPSNHVGTSDYFHKCATHYNAFVPKNWAGFEEPASGDAYAGLFTYHQVSGPYLYREYIMGRLMTTLEKGITYDVSFKYSLADESGYAIKNFGVFLTDSFSDLPNMLRVGVIPETPQLRADKFLDRTDGWETLCFSFTAEGHEKLLILGNFDHDTITEIKPNGLGPKFSYIYIDDVSVSESAKQLSLGNDTTLCNGDSLILHPLPGVKGVSFTWQDQSKDSIYAVKKSGEYWVEALKESCRYRDTLLVDVVDIPFALEDTSLCPGDTVVLNAFIQGATYIWQDNSSLPELKVSETGSYWVTVELDGCMRSDTARIVAEGCSTILNMPNIFTPNADPYNKVFQPVKYEMVRDFEIQIFNRWGEAVYESTDINSGWDGIKNGVEYPEGVYFWIIHYKDVDGVGHEQSGQVTLLR